jgi:hypothetical protein
MSLCQPRACGCSFESSTLQITGDGRPFQIETYEGVATESPDTRPGPAERFDGMRIYTSDTHRLFIWRDDLGAWVILEEPWATFAPTLTGISIGGAGAINSQIAHRSYESAHVQGQMTLGAAGNVTGNIAISVPWTAGGFVGYAIGMAQLFDASTGLHMLGDCAIATGAAVMDFNPESGTGLQVNATVPWDWNESDNIYYSIVYRVAL